MTTPLQPRRGFKSKSSEPGGPTSSRTRPWGFVTKHQISGWRFLIRRISNGVALRDTRMLTDPLRRQGRALSVGLMLGAILLAGAFILSVLRPAGAGGNQAILAERSTNALYVKIDDQLHPVLNLASARLIVGKADNPTVVKSSEIDKFPLGNTLGIPNGPSRMVQNPSRDARWMVCDAVGGPDAGTTVMSGDPVPGPGHAVPLPDSSAILATDGDKTTWLIWGNKRSEIDLTQRRGHCCRRHRRRYPQSAVDQPRAAQPDPGIAAAGRAVHRQRRRSAPLPLARSRRAGPAGGIGGRRPTTRATNCATTWSLLKGYSRSRRSWQPSCAPTTPMDWSSRRR